MSEILAAARFIHEHRRALRRLPLLDAALRPRDEPEAYAVQEVLHDLLALADEGKQAGHKIGCTTPVMQAFLGIANPCAGGVLDRDVHHSPALLRYGDYVRVGVECEIAVLLEADLPAEGAPYDRDSVASAVGACTPALELVDDRYMNYAEFDTPTLIADDFFACGCVLGEPVRPWRALDLPSVVGITTINAAEVGRGRGADVMGHPFTALAWLANQLAARGQSLRGGQFVLTGSIVATQWVAPGDHVVARIQGLGQVEARFEG